MRPYIVKNRRYSDVLWAPNRVEAKRRFRQRFYPHLHRLPPGGAVVQLCKDRP